MMEDAAQSQFLAVIRVWAALVWADGVLSSSEAEAMRRLITGAELDDDERRTALSFLEHKVELEIADLGSLKASAREGIYRAALRLAKVDRQISAPERALLTRLRTGLNIDPQLAERLEAAVASPPKPA
jgi:uncharacterized membrane protein YebE (DUF533 family)